MIITGHSVHIVSYIVVEIFVVHFDGEKVFKLYISLGINGMVDIHASQLLYECHHLAQPGVVSLR